MPALGKAGFSLVELLVSMTLFAIATLGLSAGVAMVSRTGVLSDTFTRATILAQEKLEELAAQEDPLADGADTPHPGFTREWTVSPDDPATGVSRVDVTVTWEGNESRSVTLVTVINE
jgi:prepilin-type N-terminal cleavage/methylation domain-containing protein